MFRQLHGHPIFKKKLGKSTPRRETGVDITKHGQKVFVLSNKRFGFI